jgi:hypothetical protein
MPPSLTDRTVCSGQEQLSFELLANPAADANVPAQNVHTKHCHEIHHARTAWVKTLVSLYTILPKRIAFIKQLLLTLKILMFDSF